MKATYHITTLRETSKRWQWNVWKGLFPQRGWTHVAGGYCQTKRDALNDAGIWVNARRKEEQ